MLRVPYHLSPASQCRFFSLAAHRGWPSASASFRLAQTRWGHTRQRRRWSGGLDNHRCRVWNGCIGRSHLWALCSRTLLTARSHDCGSYAQLRSQFCLELGSQFHTCVENVLYSTYSSGQLVVCTKSNTVCCINVSVTSAVEFYDLKRLRTHTQKKKPWGEFAVLTFAGLLFVV